MVSREFDGDLFVTDPMYVMREGEDWGRSAYGFRMEELGVRTYLTAETLMGDWDCGAYDAVTGKKSVSSPHRKGSHGKVHKIQETEQCTIHCT